MVTKVTQLTSSPLSMRWRWSNCTSTLDFKLTTPSIPPAGLADTSSQKSAANSCPPGAWNNHCIHKEVTLPNIFFCMDFPLASSKMDVWHIRKQVCTELPYKEGGRHVVEVACVCPNFLKRDPFQRHEEPKETTLDIGSVTQPNRSDLLV